MGRKGGKGARQYIVVCLCVIPGTTANAVLSSVGAVSDKSGVINSWRASTSDRNATSVLGVQATIAEATPILIITVTLCSSLELYSFHHTLHHMPQAHFTTIVADSEPE